MIDHFDHLSSRYYEFVDRIWYDAGYFHSRELEATRRYMPSPGPVWMLDAGCGPGRHTAVLIESGHRVVALDFSRKMLHETRDRVGELGRARLDLVQADVRFLPFRERSLTFAVCLEVIEHLTDSERSVPQTLTQLRQVLRETGRLLIEAPLNAHGLLNRVLRGFPSWKELTDNERKEYYESKPLRFGQGVSGVTMRRFLRLSGFRVVATLYIRVLPSRWIEHHPRASNLDRVLERVPILRFLSREAIWIVTPRLQSGESEKRGAKS